MIHRLIVGHAESLAWSRARAVAVWIQWFALGLAAVVAFDVTLRLVWGI